jgi:regulator of cell morphogenesis and NO signaling
MNTIELTERALVPFESEEPTYELKLSGSTQFSELDINSLIDLIIKEYHFKARKDVVAIYDLAQKVFFSHSGKNTEVPKLVETLFLFFDDLLFHLKKEEQILFPNILHLTEKKLHEGSFNYSTFGVIKEYALTMQNEHLEVIKQFGFLRRLTNNYTLPGDTDKLYQTLVSKMKAFENEMMWHIKLENDFLFPKAIKMDEN